LDECDAASSVRIILDAYYRCFHIKLLAFEVNESVFLLVTTADVTAGDATLVVTSTGSLLRPKE
jgi:hypothetical protein